MTLSPQLQSLSRSVHPTVLLNALLDSLKDRLTLHEAGLGLADLPNDRWHVLAYAAPAGRSEALDGQSSFSKTVGERVVSSKQPFIGSCLADVEAFPGTYDSMRDRGLKSALAVPLETGHPEHSVLYLLSRDENAFREQDLEIVLPVARSIERLLGSFLELRNLSQGRTTPSAPAARTELSLQTAQRQHIEHVLRMTGGVIEGPRGAAKLLDIPPSTLRKRMRKIGASRHPASV